MAFLLSTAVPVAVVAVSTLPEQPVAHQHLAVAVAVAVAA